MRGIFSQSVRLINWPTPLLYGIDFFQVVKDKSGLKEQSNAMKINVKMVERAAQLSRTVFNSCLKVDFALYQKFPSHLA